MGFVDDDGVVLAQVAVLLDLGQKDAVGHDLDEGLGTGAVLETDLVAHRAPGRLAHFLGDPPCHRCRGDPSRLGAADPAGDAPPRRQAILRQLGRLAGTGFARDDHHRMGGDGGDDVLFPLEDRQTGNIGEPGPVGRAPLLAGRRF